MVRLFEIEFSSPTSPWKKWETNMYMKRIFNKMNIYFGPRLVNYSQLKLASFQGGLSRLIFFSGLSGPSGTRFSLRFGKQPLYVSARL